MTENREDTVFTAPDSLMGPEDFGGDEFALPSEEWLVQGFERNLSALRAGVPLPNLKNMKVSKSSANESFVEDGTQASLYEQAIIELDVLKDSLIEEFHKNKDDKKLFKIIEGVIHQVENTIQKLGGEIDIFNPLSHMSGLEDAPEEDGKSKEDLLLTNAKTVVANTKKHYTIHSLAAIDPKIVKGKPAVILQIQGKDESGPFRIVGAVVAKDDFFGNEAIDYVRHEGQGRLSIKSFRNGNWQDKSDDFHFAIENRPVNP
ncbi:MAG: hypothetical protein M0R32_03575 [Candidatus Cloacimonetes bacterium]|jgi:hypothetical protein|nr:hypothetical protein [Candidatus Cloacimonadota bacterium]